MRLMKMLYTACNTEDHRRLALVESEFDRLTREAKLSEQEEDAFRTILDIAKRGEWQDAEEAAYQFAEDQIGRGHPSTTLDPCCKKNK